MEAFDASSSRSWATALGLVHVPLFGRSSEKWDGECSVLLDGQSSSLAFYTVDGAQNEADPRPVQWSWSANLRNTLLVNAGDRRLVWQQWDVPDRLNPRHLPVSQSEASKLFLELRSARVPQASDVVLCVLRAFRQLRGRISGKTSLDSVLAFNALLVGTDSVRAGDIKEQEWFRCGKLDDALHAVRDAGRLEETGASEISDRARQMPLDGLLQVFLRPDPRTGWKLAPSLLLRHASGQLYQEANLMIEQETRQTELPGFGGDRAPTGRLERYVRFTPPVLARILAERSLDVLLGASAARTGVELLDPACGSGVFLQEALRELQARNFPGRIVLRGFDKSAESCAIAQFCLGRARLDAEAAGMCVTVDIRKMDALQTDWGIPDVILMNPPFVAYPDMTDDERTTVHEVLGSLAQKRVDMAMAFLWKAADSVGAPGAVAAVLPAPMLESQSGTRWRGALADKGVLRLIGRLCGYGFFRGSMVEPAFLLLERRAEAPETGPPAVQVVLAEPGDEGEAIRALRLSGGGTAPPLSEGYEVFSVARSTFNSASWLPRPRQLTRIVDEFERLDHCRVEDLFDVHESAKTGCNRAFILTAQEYESLPRGERKYFRPTAGTRTIADGQIHKERYVFFPYDESGCRIQSEDDLRAKVGRYYAGWLDRNKTALLSRQRVSIDAWWLLTLERTWQWGRVPKIVTKAWGLSGGFAYDDTGEFAVVGGHAWLWKKAEPREAGTGFDGSLLPWAYLAILNSVLFEHLVACSCPRVQGGQYDLSPQFVGRVFLPDLSAPSLPSDALCASAELGQRIHRGDMPDCAELDTAAAKAYPSRVAGCLSELIGERQTS